MGLTTVGKNNDETDAASTSKANSPGMQIEKQFHNDDSIAMQQSQSIQSISKSSSVKSIFDQVQINAEWQQQKDEILGT
jgi:hypothetical protein